MAESNEAQQMRQDAIRRAQEMYRRAQIPAPNEQRTESTVKEASAQNRPEKSKYPPGYSGSAFGSTEPALPSEKQPEPPGFFQALFSDGERNLLLGILLLLSEEKDSDPALTFALLYLLL